MFYGQHPLKYCRTWCYHYNRSDVSERGACSFTPGLILNKMSGAGSFLNKDLLQLSPQDKKLDRTYHMNEVQKPETGGL